MPQNLGRVIALLRERWQWLKGPWIGEVPEDDALCEFDCRKNQCRHDEWASCERRISKAAGELMPPASRASSPQKNAL